VEKGDIYTLIGGFICVLVVAILVKPGALSSVLPQPAPTAVQPVHTVVPVTALPADVNSSTVIHPGVTATPRPVNPPYRIFYTSNPFSHPVVRLPENMETFGASDILWKGQDLIPFAYLEESRGGVTGDFSVPYEVWMMNITMTADRQPQYARFRMALCDSKDGAFLEGVEILNRGTMYKIVQVSNTKMYMIISSENVDRFRISLETPRNYYEKNRAGK
jgi:hypothetical protein